MAAIERGHDPDRGYAIERIARRPKLQHAYALRGRVKCQICGSAMVGHTMIDKGRPYHYYHCRLAFDRRTGRECSGRNIRAERLETAIWQEVRAKLTTPEIILHELQRGQPEPDLHEVSRIEERLAEIGDQEKRLVKHLASGLIDEALVLGELGDLKRQRTTLQAQLRELRPTPTRSTTVQDADLFVRACRAVNDFLENAGSEDRTLALEALQIAVRAATTEAEVTGVVPIDTDSYPLTNTHAHESPAVSHTESPVRLCGP